LPPHPSAQDAPSSSSSDAIGTEKSLEQRELQKEREALKIFCSPLSHPRPLPLRYKKIHLAPAAAACAALESGALRLANHPTVGLFYVRDHVRASLPSALATARLLDSRVTGETRAAAHDAGAASEAVAMLRGAAPGAIERMDAALASAAASLAAIEKGRRGGGGSSGGSPFPPPPPPKPPRPGGAGPGALLSSLYEAATGGGKKQ
jgi:hypothetical protein